MEITWLGQAGLMFESAGLRIMVDPYLSDSVEKIEPHNARRVPVCKDFFDCRPDVLIITHDHLDHFDPETLDVFFSRYEGITVLAAGSAWEKVHRYGIKNNYVLFNPGTHVILKGAAFHCIRAEHSDPAAIGVVIETDKKYYVTGDTLFNDKVVLSAARLCPDVVFLPVNGAGDNMNMQSAAAFLMALNSASSAMARTNRPPVKAVPMHVGLFDSLKGEDFPYENKVVPEFYKKINL